MAVSPMDERGVVLACPDCGEKNRIPPEHLGETGRCGSCQVPLPALDLPLGVSSSASFARLVAAAPLPLLVDFWAGWCGPCQMVAPEVEELARVQAGRLVVAKVDTESVPDPGLNLGIRSIPTFVLFHKGREVERLVGAHPAEGLAAFVERALHRSV